jgi:hypothetical protein
MDLTTRLQLVKPTHGINEVEGETATGQPNEAFNLDAIDAAIAAPYQVALYNASAAITQKEGIVELVAISSTSSMTLADPATPADDGRILYIIAGTPKPYVVTIAGGISRGAYNTITFGGARGDMAVLMALAGKWFILPSINATLSTV